MKILLCIETPHDGNEELSKVLRDTGADPRKVDKEGKTALNYAIEDNYTGLCELLLHYGANTF